MLQRIHLLLVLVSAQLLRGEDQGPFVQTRIGRVRGVTLDTHIDGKKVDAFFGIPYARPPVAERRFRHPEPADPWTGVLDATRPSSICVQAVDANLRDSNVSKLYDAGVPIREDCLTVNVWVPRPTPQGAAVMVWIHGGAFTYGGINYPVYDSKVLCSEEQVIVVSVAYRLGALGFLYLDRPDVPGNAGLMDQKMALEWMRDNIRNFGGDPNSITLFGHSAGAASTTLHLLSPLSRDLFARAVVQSGSLPAPWLPMDKSAGFGRGLELAERLRCPHDPEDVEAVITCLRARDPEDIARVQHEIPNGFMDFPFLPIVDDLLVHRPIEDTLGSMNFAGKDILLGVATQDGMPFAAFALPDTLREDTPLGAREFRTAVKSLYPSIEDLILDVIEFEYLDWESSGSSIANRDAVGKITTDRYFICPANRFALQYAKSDSRRVYMYIIDHLSSVEWFPRWMGAYHSTELPYVFGRVLTPDSSYTEKEMLLSRRMMRYWANFARTGNPNRAPDGTQEDIPWPRYTPEDQEYLNLTTKPGEVGRRFRAKQCALWQKLIPDIERHFGEPESTKPPESRTYKSTWLETLYDVIVVIAFIFFIGFFWR